MTNIEKVFLSYAGAEHTPAALIIGDLRVFLPRKLTWFERRFGIRVPYQEFRDVE